MKRNKQSKTGSRGSYSAKMAAGHVPIRHSRFPKFGEVDYVNLTTINLFIGE